MTIDVEQAANLFRFAKSQIYLFTHINNNDYYHCITKIGWFSQAKIHKKRIHIKVLRSIYFKVTCSMYFLCIWMVFCTNKNRANVNWGSTACSALLFKNSVSGLRRRRRLRHRRGGSPSHPLCPFEICCCCFMAMEALGAANSQVQLLRTPIFHPRPALAPPSLFRFLSCTWINEWMNAPVCGW